MNAKLNDLLRELGPSLAEHAARHDAEGSFVHPAYEMLERHALFSVGIPDELGGHGASYEQTCEVVRDLAHHCPSTALAFSMHAHLVAATVWKYRHGQPGEDLLRRVAAKQTVLLSTGASDWIDSNGRMERVQGGYRLTAKKVFGSGGPAAEIIVTSARFDDPHRGELVLHFPVSMSDPGVRVDDDWDTLGMRGTGSHTIHFEDVFVPDEAIALERPRGEWHPVWSVVLTVAPPLYTAAYVGIAEAAAQRVLAVAREQPNDERIALAGELCNHLHTVRTLWRAMVNEVAEYDFSPSVERANRQLVGKTLVASACVATVDKAMELAGGRAYFRSFELERLLRDVRGAPLHPLPEKRQQRFTGLLALGLDPLGHDR